MSRAEAPELQTSEGSLDVPQTSPGETPVLAPFVPPEVGNIGLGELTVTSLVFAERRRETFSDKCPVLPVPGSRTCPKPK